MYNEIITWFKLYSDLYMKDYYDIHGDPNWYTRGDTISTLVTDPEDPEYLPCGVARDVYLFTVDFYTPTTIDHEIITTAFENLISDLRTLYIKNDMIDITFNSASTHIKITGLSHAPFENTADFGYRLHLDITHVGNL